MDDVGELQKVDYQVPSWVVSRKIVSAALSWYRENREKGAVQYGQAGAEVALLFLHLVERHLAVYFSDEIRDEVTGELVACVINEYGSELRQHGMTEPDVERIQQGMLADINVRQQAYSHCRCLALNGEPEQGSLIFALGAFIGDSLEKTKQGSRLPQNLCTGSQDGPPASGWIPDAEYLGELLRFVGKKLIHLQFKSSVAYLADTFESRQKSTMSCR